MTHKTQFTDYMHWKKVSIKGDLNGTICDTQIMAVK
jgi:hypothetical protein